VDDTLAMLVVTEVLVASYPTWTDEHGTNVEQLAAIAVEALATHGLLVQDTVGRAENPQPSPQAVLT
jgi:hypothetical protein